MAPTSTTTPSSSAAGAAPPPFDAECGAALAAVGDLVPSSMRPEEVGAVRAAMSSVAEELPDFVDTEFDVSTRSVPGPPGAPDISLLVLRPRAAGVSVPAVYWIHGGGMVMGDVRTGLAEVLVHARELQAAVVSVEYRLAPEHPHPAPVEDCYAGLVWTVEHADELGILPERVLVGGSSAGGGLAAAVALLARDRRGPALVGQLLLCPMLDDRNETVSSHQMAGVGVWDRTSNETGWQALLGDARGGPDVPPYAAPARATDLSGLPPAFVDVGSAETFRDEDVAYATAIWQAGGEAELHVWPGGFHGYSLLAPHAHLSRVTVAARRGWLQRLLAP